MCEKSTPFGPPAKAFSTKWLQSTLISLDRSHGGITSILWFEGLKFINGKKNLKMV
jgi:hypothetical protein